MPSTCLRVVCTFQASSRTSSDWPRGTWKSAWQSLPLTQVIPGVYENSPSLVYTDVSVTADALMVS